MKQVSSDLEIQQADTEADVDRINEFFNSKAIKEALHRFTYRTTLDRAFERDDRRLYYVEDEGEVIGALMVWCESRVLEDEEAQIRLVAVDPEYREQGLAHRLCNRAEEFAHNYGSSKMSADVARDSPAVEFWRACGYEVGYEWETDGGREMYRVVKSL